jgi:hypothetical protein
MCCVGQGLKAIQTVARILVEEKKLVGSKPDWYKILDVSAETLPSPSQRFGEKPPHHPVVLS